MRDGPFVVPRDVNDRTRHHATDLEVDRPRRLPVFLILEKLGSSWSHASGASADAQCSILRRRSAEGAGSLKAKTTTLWHSSSSTAMTCPVKLFCIRSRL